MIVFFRFLTVASLLACSFLTASAHAETIRSGELLEEVHFLIPAGPGGGWDGTARGIGEALRRSGLVEKVSYENLSGGGGGRAGGARGVGVFAEEQGRGNPADERFAEGAQGPHIASK